MFGFLFFFAAFISEVVLCVKVLNGKDAQLEALNPIRVDFRPQGQASILEGRSLPDGPFFKTCSAAETWVLPMKLGDSKETTLERADF